MVKERVRVLTAVLAAVAALALLPASGTAAPGRDRSREMVPCSRGLVALTFDDGPLETVTPRLVRVLHRLEVPATFFMVGNRVVEHPDLVRRVQRAGFTIGNHTWAHTDLTSQRPVEARHALMATQRALAEAGATPTDLARPPYGAIDDRTRRLMARIGLVPVLWTVDSRDWTGLTPAQITDRVLDGVRPHQANVVLQHDGVTNSPATLRAVPREVAALRDRGYCFASLDAAGHPTPPIPVASIHADDRRVREGDRIGLSVRLDQPTTRPVVVRTTAGTVHLPRGQQVVHLSSRAPQDRTDERPEVVTFTVDGGRGIEPAAPAVRVRVVDDDPAPVVSVEDAVVTASPLGPVPAPVVVGLDRASDRDLTVRVRSRLGPTQVVVPAGSRRATGDLAVPAGRRSDDRREVELRSPGATAVLTVRPPQQTWLEAARAAVATVRWPTVTLPRLI